MYVVRLPLTVKGSCKFCSSSEKLFSHYFMWIWTRFVKAFYFLKIHIKI